VKVLLDTCVSGQAAEALRQAGHDVIWAGDWPSDPGDTEILRRAAEQGRVLVTIDKDFGELVIVQGIVHVGLIRLVGFRAREQGPALAQLFSKYEPELAAGAILTAEPWRVRIRPAAAAVQRPAIARVVDLKMTMIGEIPPGDISSDCVRSAKWPLDFSMEIAASFDRPVTSASASIEIIEQDTGTRVARLVKPIDPAERGRGVQSWHGKIELASITKPGSYRIVIHCDGVEPVELPLRALSK
jgi:predicted nuclease of predicted toxin-antitoxin system